METEEILRVAMIIKIAEAAVGSPSEILFTTEVEVKIIPLEGKEDNGIVMTLLIRTGITGTETQMAQTIQGAVKDGRVIEA